MLLQYLVSVVTSSFFTYRKFWPDIRLCDSRLPETCVESQCRLSIMERCSTQYTHVVVDVGAWPSYDKMQHAQPWIERARPYPLSLIHKSGWLLNPVCSTVDLITSHQWKSITLDSGYKKTSYGSSESSSPQI